MGYTTDFNGSCKIEPPLTKDQVAYLQRFAETRRMKRNPEVAETLPDPLRTAVGLTIGDEGAFFVGGSGYAGQYNDASVVGGNSPPKGQPGLWCQWVVSDDGTEIGWDGGEKFYNYVEWMSYLIENFFKPWGRTLNGEIEWYGEDRDDVGVLSVDNNCVTASLVGDD